MGFDPDLTGGEGLGRRRARSIFEAAGDTHGSGGGC